jgi:hypothetical protein
MSTVWIVPFFMFFDVTIIVAVPLVAATTQRRLRQQVRFMI